MIQCHASIRSMNFNKLVHPKLLVEKTLGTFLGCLFSDINFSAVWKTATEILDFIPWISCEVSRLVHALC